MKSVFCKFSILAALCSFVVICRAADQPPAHTLDIYWNDVEGGGATLIVTPAGESILIDSGNPGGRDAGRIFKTTQIAGLKKIDYYFTTHFHIDHYGGAAELSKLIPIGEVLDRGIPDSDPDHNPRRNELAEHHQALSRVRGGQTRAPAHRRHTAAQTDGGQSEAFLPLPRRGPGICRATRRCRRQSRLQ